MSTLQNTIGNTPLIKLQRLTPANGSEIWLKLEGNNPAGSVKDRAAWSMIHQAELRGEIAPGDRLIEATSGNTGIALAMMARGEGHVLDQFNNPDNPLGHYQTTGPEIWQQSAGRLTHFVSSMGTTGTITGVGRYLKEQSDRVAIIGLQPEEGSAIPGIRRWPQAYLPGIYRPELVDELMDMGQAEAEETMRALARREGIFCGVSSGGAVAGALRIAQARPGSVIVAIVCDRGDRYLSTGVYR